ncbi:MAG: hemerythrin domain-containing protein [Magnetovibrionaceae bacterium]
MDNAIKIIREEHAAIGRILACLEDVAESLVFEGGQGSLELMSSCLCYMRLFPEELHHPKEERYLFAALKRRTRSADLILRRLQAQHVVASERTTRIESLMWSLADGSGRMTEAAAQTLRGTVQDYVAFQRDHIDEEERLVLPLAREVLHASDWREISKAFQRNRDPLFGDNRDEPFQALHDHILRTTIAA